MKKIFLTMPHYTGERLSLYKKYMEPRNKAFCKLHDYKYVATSPDTLTVTQLLDGIAPRDNFMFFRWKVIKDAIEAGTLKDGDIVTQFDCDVYIAQLKYNFETKKSFTYAIDSGNTHCLGIFSLRINEFTKRLIDAIICPQRHYKCSRYPLFTENGNHDTLYYANDQHAYYHIAGIKPHSWKSFLDLPNYGFHSLTTPNTLFTLKELLDNVEVLGPEWNTTHLVEETGDNGKPNTYDIVRTTRDQVIYRHFAGGQPWLCQQWENYSKKYE